MFKRFSILFFVIPNLSLFILLSFSPKINAENILSEKNESNISMGSFDFYNVEQKTYDIEDFLNFSKNFCQSPTNFLFLGDLDERDVSKIQEYLSQMSYRMYWSDFWNRFSFSKYPIGYNEVRTFVVDLITKYYNQSKDHDKKNVYLFIGASSIAPVIAFLEALKANSNVINNKQIKQSLDNSIFIDVPYSVSLLNEQPPITEKELCTHFSKYLDPNLIKDNNLIFVDLAMSGVNIGSFIRAVKKYLLLSNVKENSFSADIFTFFPQDLYSNFLNNLSSYPNIHVEYSKKYFSFLMRNLYVNEYDDAFSEYYDVFSNDVKRNIYLSYYGDYLYVSSFFDREFIYFSGESVYIDKINKMYEPFLVNGKYVNNWMDYIRSNEKIPVNKKFENLKKIYMETIEKDSFLNGTTFCSNLFKGLGN